jgi:hypothetical protein
LYYIYITIQNRTTVCEGVNDTFVLTQL